MKYISPPCPSNSRKCYRLWNTNIKQHNTTGSNRAPPALLGCTNKQLSYIHSSTTIGLTPLVPVITHASRGAYAADRIRWLWRPHHPVAFTLRWGRLQQQRRRRRHQQRQATRRAIAAGNRDQNQGKIEENETQDTSTRGRNGGSAGGEDETASDTCQGPSQPPCPTSFVPGKIRLSSFQGKHGRSLSTRAQQGGRHDTTALRHYCCTSCLAGRYQPASGGDDRCRSSSPPCLPKSLRCRVRRRRDTPAGITGFSKWYHACDTTIKQCKLRPPPPPLPSPFEDAR